MENFLGAGWRIPPAETVWTGKRLTDGKMSKGVVSGMEKISTYEQYSEVLAAFKNGKARCATNKLLTRDELTALITAGKLYYAEIDGVLWFFVNEGYFYSANFYVPSGTPIRMRKQDMDVLVELTGNQTRYNEQWEKELIAAGYEKGDKRLEWGCQYEDVADYLQTQVKERRALWEPRGYTLRKAKKADYPEIHKLMEEKIGKERYTVYTMTDAELEEMVEYGRCIVICDPEGEICAASLYFKHNKTSCRSYTATYYMGSGLGSWVNCEKYLSAYQDGCTRHLTWIREGNQRSISMNSHMLKLTGKFYWQFILKAR